MLVSIVDTTQRYQKLNKMWRFLILILVGKLFAPPADNSANITAARNFDTSANISGLLDTETPQGERLSGIFKKSFGYRSMKYRLPIILERMIDSMTADRNEIVGKFGAGSSEELQKFIAVVSELRSDLTMNEPMKPLVLVHSEFDCDIAAWNDELNGEVEGKSLTFLGSSFLLSETYLYRRMNQALARTTTLKTYDPFEKQKRDSFTRVQASLTVLARHTNSLLSRVSNFSKTERRDEFVKLLKMSLWSNKYDLSLSAGAEINSSGNPLELLSAFEEDLLIDDTKIVWDVLSKPKKINGTKIVDIVLDNAGFELFTDLCLASFIVADGLAQKVRFYVKRMPWLISDVNRHDLVWLVDYMRNSSDSDLKKFGDICAEHLKNNDWTIEIESFWTEPYDFGRMKEKSPVLYGKLSEASLIVIKGDLNHRKLIGDVNWEHTMTLKTVLRRLDFRPTNLVSLRTLKSDLCVGLEPGKAEELSGKDKHWHCIGKYGLINAYTDPDDHSSDKR